MSSQWENFLGNLGAWSGTFAELNGHGEVVSTTHSLLTLAQGEEERLVHFRLQRYSNAARDGEPCSDIQEAYRNLGKQVVFFPTGTFCKGRLQVSPGTPFAAEFGFIAGDRRHRLVQLHHEDGRFEKLILIREQRVGSEAAEQAPLTAGSLSGCWQGTASTITADWPEPDQAECHFTVGSSSNRLEISDVGLGANHPEQELQLTWMADGGYHLTPTIVSHRQAFSIEAGWLSAPNRVERLIRRYDASGAWLSATQIVAERV